MITFLEAYETNRDPRYLTRADETLKFVLSGWDEESGGGIWWHQGHKDGTKNACSNGPAAVGCLRLAKFREGRGRGARRSGPQDRRVDGRRAARRRTACSTTARSSPPARSSAAS